VLAHEIAHVTQRHIARMIAQQNQSAILSLASLAVAILAARASSQAAHAALAFGQAGAIQSQLNFTRDNEREADRVGVQLLERSGFDPGDARVL
jgi:predicted Zn-dependent protease